MATVPESDRIRFNDDTSWTNWHHTVTQSIAGIYDIYNPAANVVSFDALKATAGVIQLAIGKARAEGKRVRALGSGWSLSRAPTTDGVMLNMSNLNWRMRLNATTLHPSITAEQAAGLFLVQGGSNTSEVNKYLESHGRSLRTSGAANGQAFAGAASTNTHGSALNFGGIMDHIHGIHLVTGKNSWWLERKSRPIMAAGFPAAIGATLKHDEGDDLFNAALVSFGAMGVIHAVAIETAPRFLLVAENRIFDPITPELREVMRTLDFAAHPTLFPKGKPYFLQVVVNPHGTHPAAYVTTMYQQPCPADYQPHYEVSGGIKPGYDLLSVLGPVIDKFPQLTPLAAGLAAKELMNTGSLTGTWGEIFNYKSPQTKVNSGSICVPLEHGLAALDTLLALMKSDGPVPLVFACRYVRKSPALLAFTRWDMNCVINMDGVFNKSSTAFLARVTDAIEAKGIPFTQHWGKTFHYTADRLKVYDKLDLWKQARKTLMPDQGDRDAFVSPWMEPLGLQL
ncbi:MAG: FAD-binding protein [Pseudomonadota bacterium]